MIKEEPGVMRPRSPGIRSRLGLAVLLCGLGVGMILSGVSPREASGKIYIDINAPSINKFKIAIPNFVNLDPQKRGPELATKLSGILSEDLDLSGYFSPMDKAAFLEEPGGSIGLEGVKFKNWSVIGAELLVKGGYVCIGQKLEVEIRLFDVFFGREILGKRALGEISGHRQVIHRLANEIIQALTGQPGIFLTKLAFVGKAGGFKEIYISDFDGQNIRKITKDRSLALSPRLSPQGDRLIFSSYKDGGPKLYLLNLATGTMEAISAREGLNIGGSWAPDGKRIALTLTIKGDADIYTIDPSGKLLDRITDHWGIDVSPSFSPDGTRMAFVSNRAGSPQIYVTDIAKGKREERLTFDGKYNTSPSWSSLDRIAFTSMKDGYFQIFTMNPDGSQLRQLTSGPANSEDPCWSPDGRYIVFSSNREGAYHIWLMNGNGQNQRRLIFMEGEQTAPGWSP
jgi:TolB protein